MPAAGSPGGAHPRLKLVEGGRRELRSSCRTGGAAPRLVAVVSGKGGVGKTSLAVNLAVSLAELRRRVLVVDGDFGLGQLDLYVGAAPPLNLGHVLADLCDVSDAVFTGPRGVRFLAGASGRRELAVLDAELRRRFFLALERFRHDTDLVVLDLASGIGSNPLELARHAGEVLVVTVPEPAAYADAYALIKILSARSLVAPRIVVNRARSEAEAEDTYLRLSRTAERHLGLTPVFGGWIPEDAAAGDAVRSRIPFTLGAPNAPASRSVRELAWRLVRGTPDGGDRAPVTAGDALTGLAGGLAARAGGGPARWDAA